MHKSKKQKIFIKKKISHKGKRKLVKAVNIFDRLEYLFLSDKKP